MEVIGPLLMLVSIPLIFRWIPRNRLYGFRIPATLSSDSIWYEANALSGRHMFFLGALMVALELALPKDLRIVTLRAVGVVGVVVCVAADWRTANRWRREREENPKN